MATARELLIRNAVSTETAFPEENKLRIVNFCIGNIPDGVDCKDCIVLYSVLVQMGLVNANEIPNLIIKWFGIRGWRCEGILMRSIWFFEMDQESRIVKLEFTHIARPQENREPYDLSADIGRLERLEDLSLECVRSVPEEALQRLPNLKSLTFRNCSDLFGNHPVRLNLNNLKKVEQLRFSYMGENVDSILNYLRSIENPFFQDTLKTLAVTSCSLNNTSFETLLLEILPSKFPNVSRLDVSFNNITSIQPIIERIENAKTCIASKSSLRRLDLYGNPVTSKIKRDEDPKEQAAVLNLLNRFKKIHDIGHCERKCLSKIEFTLAINHAGCCLLEGQGDDNGIDRSLPLSVWPLVLKKAQARYPSWYDLKCNYYATGIYYLLRHGPALAGRAAFGANKVEKKNPLSKMHEID